MTNSPTNVQSWVCLSKESNCFSGLLKERGLPGSVAARALAKASS